MAGEKPAERNQAGPAGFMLALVRLRALLELASMKIRTMIALLAVPGSLSVASPALAKGCIRGAMAGAVAGHYARHHAVAGAMAGCAAGHYYYKHKANTAAATPARPARR